MPRSDIGARLERSDQRSSIFRKRCILVDFKAKREPELELPEELTAFLAGMGMNER